MAKKRDSMDFLLSCQVCFEEFEEDGDHIPRLLPCTHTVCESCIKQLIKNNRLECPECREMHEAKTGEKSFSQNPYLLVQIRRKKDDKIEDKKEQEKIPGERCKKHGKELILYCFEDTCQISICVSCLVDHNKHDVKEIEVKEKELLMKELNTIKLDLEARAKIISKAKKKIAKKTGKCVSDLEKAKEAAINVFDRMITEAENQRKTTFELVDNELSAKIELLKQIQDNLKEDDATKPETLANHRETIRAILENIKANLTGTKSFKFSVFNIDTQFTESIVKYMVNGEISVFLPEYEDAAAEETENQRLPRPITNPFQLKCTGKKTFTTGIDHLYDLLVLSDGTAVISGMGVTEHQFERCDLQGGHYGLDYRFLGACRLAEINIGGKASVVYSYGSDEIRFRELKDWNNEIQHVYPVKPRSPGALCKATPHTLLYVDESKKPREVHWLDFSGSKPKPAAEKSVIHTEQAEIRDMCFSQSGDKQLLAVAGGDGGLFAYNTETDKLEWKADKAAHGMEHDMNAWGVSTDGYNHLFVADYRNQCIQMFSVSDGQYLRCLVKDTKSLDGLRRIRWYEPTSSLVCTSRSNEKWYLIDIHVEY